eukprot:SAG31_NODE_44063_length_264_cov_0.927273_1_plen_54_part_10
MCYDTWWRQHNMAQHLAYRRRLRTTAIGLGAAGVESHVDLDDLEQQLKQAQALA